MEQEKIKRETEEIEKEIRETPYHKGTERHIGRLKAKLAQLRQQLINKSGGGGGGGGFAVRKQGDATVVLVGEPSVGKSTLLNAITGAQSKVGHYPFTTLDVIPGILEYREAKIQIFDVPGLIRGAATGKGGGKEILSVVRVADLLLLMAPSKSLESFETMERELYEAGVRLNQKEPQVSITKKGEGGVVIQGTPGLSDEIITALARQFRLMNAELFFQHKITEDQFIDVLAGSRAYVDCLRVVTKSDLLSPSEKRKLECLTISSKNNEGLEELKEAIFNQLRLIQVYLRDEEPIIVRRGETVYQVADRVSHRLAEEIKGARLRGPSAQFPNQQVGLDHKLEDQDHLFFIK